MQCKYCNATLLNTDKFCNKCGKPVQDINTQNTSPINQQNNFQQVNKVPNNQNKKSSNPIKIIIIVLAIIGGFVIGIIALLITVLSLVSKNSDKLECTSDKGNITIMYNKDGLTGYKTFGLTYEFDEQKEYAKKIGIDAYLKEFNTNFAKTTSGTCTINGKKMEQDNNLTDSTNDNTNYTNYTNDTSKNNDTNINSNNTKNVTVGNEKYGYINVPSNWHKFYDVEDNDSLQYSYANVYIVSLNVLDNKYSAKEYAASYMYNKQKDNDVTGVSGATVKIGKNKEYTAYQVYMYYPSDSTYLITYWFEAEDGKVHYIALEGPKELNNIKLSDYLYIPESFSLKK